MMNSLRGKLRGIKILKNGEKKCKKVNFLLDI